MPGTSQPAAIPFIIVTIIIITNGNDPYSYPQIISYICFYLIIECRV